MRLEMPKTANHFYYTTPPKKNHAQAIFFAR